jgi:hypothetical protein
MGSPLGREDRPGASPVPKHFHDPIELISLSKARRFAIRIGAISLSKYREAFTDYFGGW